MTRGRILYVEDNVENRKLVKRILEAEGYEVVEAENGIVGLEKAKATSPDLILMDINLPDLDGYDCTARLRQTDGIGSTPILALTANVMEGDRQKALDAGCDSYIPKPIDVDQLTQMVAQFIRKESERKVGAAPVQTPKAKPTMPPSISLTATAPSNGPTARPAAPLAVPALVVPSAAGSSKPVPPPPALPSKPLPPPPPGFKIPPSIKNAPPPPPVRPPATPNLSSPSTPVPAQGPYATSNQGEIARAAEQPQPSVPAPASHPPIAPNESSDSARETTGTASEPAVSPE